MSKNIRKPISLPLPDDEFEDVITDVLGELLEVGRLVADGGIAGGIGG